MLLKFVIFGGQVARWSKIKWPKYAVDGPLSEIIFLSVEFLGFWGSILAGVFIFAYILETFLDIRKYDPQTFASGVYNDLGSWG